MNTDYGFSNNMLSKYDFGGYSSSRFNYASSNYTKSESADITIITDDGDRVTISSGSSIESSYASYSGLARSKGSILKAEGYEYQSRMRSDFSMSIVGDLDSEEYDDIISALETIDSFMKKASSGNIEDLMSMAEELGGLESLSGLSASIQVEESMSYKQVQSSVSEISEPEGKRNNGPKNAHMLEDSLGRILKSGKKHGKSHGKVKHLMNDYLSGILDSFSKKPEKNRFNREAGELMKDMIMNLLSGKSQQIENTPESSPVETSQ